MTPSEAEKLLRSLPDVNEKDHWGGDAFVANKRIFATVWHEENKVNVRLNPELQRQFMKRDPDAFSTWDNAWGRQGATSISLSHVRKKDFRDAINAAFKLSAVSLPMALSDKKRTRKNPRP
ncbi:MAG TPA: MmcQ/YjbR family DNA-binding protein [Planctomycetota bacterium]|nr:MmcQ/YjbR family DNA-binding protein [Planctomycetota bacterium]